MNIFKWFKNLFSSNNTCSYTETVGIDDNEIASIKFILTGKDSVNIICKWSDDSDEAGIIYGELLHHINNGDYSQSIGNILSKGLEENQCNDKFISNVNTGWKDKYLESNDETLKTLPLVHPMQTFGASQI